MENRLITIEEAAQILNCHPNSLRHWANQGQIRHFKNRNGWRHFYLKHVIDFKEVLDKQFWPEGFSPEPD
jgi:excisionase family DNA binding protein